MLLKKNIFTTEAPLKHITHSQNRSCYIYTYIFFICFFCLGHRFSKWEADLDKGAQDSFRRGAGNGCEINTILVTELIMKRTQHRIV